MTLTEIMNEFTSIALQDPNIHSTILNDVYRMNQKTDLEYSVFVVAQMGHRQDSDNKYFGLRLFYIDRLLDDGSNEVAIQSRGIEILSNIIKTFLDTYYEVGLDGDITYTTWTQRFIDETAGTYAELTLSIPEELCYEDYMG